ncbi:MAG: hypothetical protein ACLTQI_00985 [Slackia sp.]
MSVPGGGSSKRKAGRGGYQGHGSLPQTLINVRVKDKHALDGNEAIWGAVRTAEEAMGDSGRVLVRTSGTEPLVRVMVEAETQDVADAHARTIADVVEAQLA